MSAFVPSSITRPVLRDTKFIGTAPRTTVPRRAPVGPSLATDVDITGKKYEYMSMAAPEPVDTSKPSGVWWAYLQSIKDRAFNPFKSKQSTVTTTTYTPYVGPTQYFRVMPRGGDPDSMCTPLPKADKYMAYCVNLQYKYTAVPNGEYSVRCTEGTYKQQAEESRTFALAADYRMKQRSVIQKFADYYETRKKAIIACYDCTYEEALVGKYPASARAMVRGISEAKGTCYRYASGASKEEEYMSKCVDKQSMYRAVPYGIYDVLCCDGTAKGLAEFRRVAALSSRFRAGQIVDFAKEQVKFDAAKYARDFYSHGCDYEEGIFNKYPAVSSAMRPDAYRY